MRALTTRSRWMMPFSPKIIGNPTSYDRLRKDGIEPAFCLDHGLTISLYYKDPEGNCVELQSDNFGDWNKSSEWMRTSADFAANPIGTFFDPALVYDKMKDGADFKTLQK